MGPSNLALVRLYEADRQLRAAQDRLKAVTRNVRLQERKTTDLAEKVNLLKSRHLQQQAEAAEADLELKTREANINRLREQQQLARNNREYQAFLIEINTQKVDREKFEDQAIKAMEAAAALEKELAEAQALLAAEQTRLQQAREQITDQLAAVEREIEQLKPAREAAAGQVSKEARDTFERLAERFDGEALSKLTRPDPRSDEYVCDACNLSLVVDVYNRLHSRDELVFCPACRRILYIPEDLSPEQAIKGMTPAKPKPEKKPRAKKAKVEKSAATAPGEPAAASDAEPAESTQGTPHAAEA